MRTAKFVSTVLASGLLACAPAQAYTLLDLVGNWNFDYNWSLGTNVPKLGAAVQKGKATCVFAAADASSGTMACHDSKTGGAVYSGPLQLINGGKKLNWLLDNSSMTQIEDAALLWLSQKLAGQGKTVDASSLKIHSITTTPIKIAKPNRLGSGKITIKGSVDAAAKGKSKAVGFTYAGQMAYRVADSGSAGGRSARTCPKGQKWNNATAGMPAMCM